MSLADRLNHSSICIALSNAAGFYAHDHDAPSTDGLKVIECRRSSRGNERLEFWRVFTNTAYYSALPALAAMALSRASSEIV